MFTFKKLAAPLAALALPVLLATSASAQGKMMDHKMSGGKMSGGKMSGGKMSGGKMSGKKGMSSMVSVKSLVPTYGSKPSAKELAGAKVVKTTMMMGKPCYTVKLTSGKMVQMCRPADQKMMAMHMGGKMSGGKMSGGKMMDHKMGGKM